MDNELQGRAEELLRACAEGEADPANDTTGGGRRIKSEEGRGREANGPTSGGGGGSGSRMGKGTKGDSPAGGVKRGDGAASASSAGADAGDVPPRRLGHSQRRAHGAHVGPRICRTPRPAKCGGALGTII